MILTWYRQYIYLDYLSIMLKTAKKKTAIDRIVETLTLMRSLTHQRQNFREVSFLKTMVLHFIHERGEPTVKELADILQITMPSMTAMVNELAKLGLATRKRDIQDKRLVHIMPTTKGKEMLKKNMKGMELRMRDNLKKLSVREQEQLADIMQKIYTHAITRHHK